MNAPASDRAPRGGDGAAKPELFVHNPPYLSDGQAAEMALRRLAAVLTVLLALSFPIEMATTGRALDVLNAVVPMVIMLASLGTAYQVVSANHWALLTPVPWFLGAAAAYCGFGPLSYTFGSDEAVAYMNQLCLVDAANLARTNRLNLVGLIMVLVGLLAGDRVLRGKECSILAAPADGKEVRPAGTKTAAIVFLAIGLPIKYGFALPYEFGQLNFVLPGIVYTLENCVLLGLFLLSFGSVGAGRSWTLILLGLLGIEVTVSLLRFTKTAILMTMALPLLGRYLATGRMRVLLAGGVIICTVYLLVSPIITWGRDAVYGNPPRPVEVEIGGSEKPQASLLARWQIVRDAVGPLVTGQIARHGNPQSWWTRLSYANAQAFAMSCYDTGYDSDSFSAAPYIAVPRVLWPEKPLISGAGQDFTQLTLGHRNSSTGLGIFGEAYWNGGWLLVVILSASVGLLFAFFSRLALVLLPHMGWVFLPCAFLGLRMGFRIDGWIVGEYLGGFVLYLACLLVVNLLFKLQIQQSMQR